MCGYSLEHLAISYNIQDLCIYAQQDVFKIPITVF